MSGERGTAGEVFLVGAGPGAADLLTLRALRLMAKAEVVVYDRLVGPEILDLVPARAERIFVGKMRDRHVLPQAEINALLIQLARAGRRVLRLKGGDPFIFGRGGEELEALVAAGVACEVVPGVTAALGCAAAAGIPLTHRDHAHTLVFVSGHTASGKVDLDWPALTRPGHTVVVYMGIKALASLCRQLVSHGRAPDTPAVIVENGTLPHQRVVRGTLATLPTLAADHHLCGPSLIIVGEVVGLHDRGGGHDDQAQPQDAAAGDPSDVGATRTPDASPA